MRVIFFYFLAGLGLGAWVYLCSMALAVCGSTRRKCRSVVEQVQQRNDRQGNSTADHSLAKVLPRILR